jgi:predicted  nucleic acid-binding Zn-ribbon protein
MSAFTEGGAVAIGNHYVERDADAELLRRLADFRSCYVFAPRQIGKSSLRKHVAEKLRAAGHAVVDVDFVTLGGCDSKWQFWRHITSSVEAALLDLDVTVKPWWPNAEELQPSQPWAEYMLDEVIPRVPSGLILLFDEVNVLLGFRIDIAPFFGALRSLLERQSEQPKQKRFAACLFGVVRQVDLTQVRGSGGASLLASAHPIALEDFTQKEAYRFEPLLDGRFADSKQIIKAVYARAGGHPYMLQKILSRALELVSDEDKGIPDPSGDTEKTDELIDGIIKERFGKGNDFILEEPEKRFGGGQLSKERLDALNQYRLIIADNEVAVAEHEGLLVQEELRLAGMVRFARGKKACVRVRNKIFADRYPLAWVSNIVDRRVYETLATRWKQEKEHPDFLLRGRSLAAAEQWRNVQEGSVAVMTADFIHASAQHAERERSAEERRTSRSRRLTLTSAGVMTCLVASLALVYYANQQERGLALAAQSKAYDAQLKLRDASLASMQAQVDQYVSEADRLKKDTESLSTKVDTTEQQLSEYEGKRADIERKYNNAVAQGSREKSFLAQQLESIKKVTDVTRNERDRVQLELRAAKQRSDEIEANSNATRTKFKAAEQDIGSTAAAAAPPPMASTLGEQMETLKSQITQISAQLADAQARYKTCDGQLSNTRSALDTAQTKLATCEAKPPPLCATP